MTPALIPYADPDLLAIVDRLVENGHPELLVQAARNYVEADAEYSRLLKEAMA